ncbi:MAG TPA: hypothetical protein VIA06_09620 [Candidatus Dormibacteraeota bacterium]|nr:hypothetical protein [Candidatus Dormibacteraeota bacterium]
MISPTAPYELRLAMKRQEHLHQRFARVEVEPELRPRRSILPGLSFRLALSMEIHFGHSSRPAVGGGS